MREFQKTLPQLSVDRVQRVENGYQHESFHVAAAAIKQKLGPRYIRHKSLALCVSFLIFRFLFCLIILVILWPSLAPLAGTLCAHHSKENSYTSLASPLPCSAPYYLGVA